MKQIRFEMNMTAKAFPSLLDISHTHLFMLESGNTQMTETRANDIAEKLHVGVDWLLYGEERAKECPIDTEMVDWLKDHPEKRIIIKKWMEEENRSSSE